MTYWQVRAEQNHGPGMVIRTLGVQAPDGQGALAVALQRMGVSAYGSRFDIREIIPPGERLTAGARTA
jgi:hypothetical protein